MSANGRLFPVSIIYRSIVWAETADEAAVIADDLAYEITRDTGNPRVEASSAPIERIEQLAAYGWDPEAIPYSSDLSDERTCGERLK